MLSRSREADHARDERLVATVCAVPVLLGEPQIQSVGGTTGRDGRHSHPRGAKAICRQRHDQRGFGLHSGCEIGEARTDDLVPR